MRAQLKKDDAFLFFQELKANPEVEKTIIHANEKGVIWKKYWKYEDGTYKAKVCLPTDICIGWTPFEDGKALECIRDDFRIVQNNIDDMKAL